MTTQENNEEINTKLNQIKMQLSVVEKELEIVHTTPATEQGVITNFNSISNGIADAEHMLEKVRELAVA